MKQIEEMAKHCHFYKEGKCLLLEEDTEECDMNCDMCKFAKTLYNAGYRKQSEVAREIFEEIEKFMLDGEIGGKYPTKVINPDKYTELKKKYTEVEE